MEIKNTSVLNILAKSKFSNELFMTKDEEKEYNSLKKLQVQIQNDINTIIENLKLEKTEFEKLHKKMEEYLTLSSTFNTLNLELAYKDGMRDGFNLYHDLHQKYSNTNFDKLF